MSEVVQKTEFYLNLSSRYLSNAFEELNKGEGEKASEFLWGSVAEALKAFFMARKGLEIKSHGEFWNIARELEREFPGEGIYTLFREANSLHSNFYEAKLKVKDIESSFEQLRLFLSRFYEIVRRELR